MIDDVAKQLSEAEAAAVCGRFEFRDLVEQEVGEAKLYDLGIWKRGRLKRGECIQTDFGLRVRKHLLDGTR